MSISNINKNPNINVILIALITVIASVALSYFVASNVSSGTHANTHAPTEAMHGDSHAKLMVHVSSSVDDPHSVMMGLQKALKAAEAGADVFLFMDVKATDLALKSTNIKFADFDLSQDIIKDLVAKGVDVYVCPHCLMVNGNKMSEVQDGIKELTMGALMEFGQGSGVTTLDY